MNTNYSSRWKKVDSFMYNDQSVSAQKEVERILKQARSENNTEEYLHALCMLRVTQEDRDENARKNDILFFEKELQGAVFPAKHLIHSITADLYWSYYEEHRWEIMNRTKLATTAQELDIETWGADQFYKKVYDHFLASLAMPSESKKYSVEKISKLIDPGKNTELLRPTLYDLLAHRAIQFFEQDEMEITKPEYAFELNDEKAFESAAVFAAHRFTSQDSTSPKFTALTLFQDILELHLQDKNPSALIDADILRLTYVLEKSTLQDKQERYRNALRTLAERYPKHEGAGLALYLLAETYQDQDNYRSYTPANLDKSNYIEVVKWCNRIQQDYPGTEADNKAKALLQEVYKHHLMLTTEKAILPKQSSLAKIQFRNISKLHCRLAQLTREDYLKLQRYDTFGEEGKNAFLLSRKAIKTWSLSLPKSEDYKQHSTEIEIAPVDKGFYVVLISESASFGEGTETAYAVFQASELAYILPQHDRTQQSELYVVHRETGAPLNGVQVKTWIYNYDYNARSRQMTEGSSYVSDAQGRVAITAFNQNVIPELIQGEDHLLLFDHIYKGESFENYPDQTRAFLFTDRSIYRPGQTIYFKAILLNSKGKGYKQHQLLKNKKTNVKFFDANYQLIKEVAFTTNNFGSLSGSFVAPEGLLTGQFHIQCENDQAYFSVEEYKRPKFEVVIDTLKGAYRVQDNITVHGKAKAYAGNAIDGAVVKYQVKRTARFPYWWCYYRWGMPSSEEMAIAHGSTKTNQQGEFEFTFTAKPDASVNKESLPVFDYEITTDVTDINGETRSKGSSVSVGYQSVLLRLTATEVMDKKEYEALALHSENLSGTYVPATVVVSLSKLKTPDKMFRSRLWEKVDMPLFDKEEFRKKFPFDEFGDENNQVNWEIENTVFSKTIQSSEEGKLNLQLPERDGYYVLEAKTKDKSGDDVIEKKYFRLLTTDLTESLNNEALRARADKENYQPGEQALWHIASYFDQVYALYGTSIPSIKDNTLQWLSIHPSKKITYAIKEEDRGGFYSHVIFVKQNRAYTAAQRFAVPYTNKELLVTTETFRDKMLPGSEQEWTIKISGSKKETVSAELLATLYDASLDAFKPHQWRSMSLYPNNYPALAFNTGNNFTSNTGSTIYSKIYPEIPTIEKYYNELLLWGLSNRGGGRNLLYADSPIMFYKTSVGAPGNSRVKFSPPVIKKAEEVGTYEAVPAPEAASLTVGGDAVTDSVEQVKPVRTDSIPLRSNFAETAFFFPQLRTDEQGNVLLKFKAPDALTQWKMMAFAHSESLQEGMLTKTSLTQKDVMIVPNTPRFLREGDVIYYTAKISNLSLKELKGNALLQIMNAQNDKNVDDLFKNTSATLPVVLPAQGSMAVSWKLQIPEGFTQPVYVKTYIQTAEASDGEQNTLPVLLNSMLVTETLPMNVKANEKKKFTFSKLLQSANSKTLKHHGLTVEYTANPAWYAVQALPYLTDYPYDCAEQTFNRFYANALATYMANSNPKIKDIFSSWKETNGDALQSNLEKNQELKNVLLQETPWVLQAQSETAQKKNLQVLFDVHRMAKELERTTRELEILQTPNGGFSWFKGMQDSRYITQYIISGIGRLQRLGVKEIGSEKRLRDIVSKAIPYLDSRLMEDYQELVKRKAKLTEVQISYDQIQWLYMRSFFIKEFPLQEKTKTAFKFYKEQCAAYWMKQNRYMQAMSAVALHRLGDKVAPQKIVTALRENAIHNEELGMYWKEINRSYWWYEAPIESMSMLIECFREVAMNEEEVDEMKIWLLKHKQTHHWQTTKATADACYALLLNGTYWLASQPDIHIALGSKSVHLSETNTEAGTGYLKESVSAESVSSSMGAIQVEVKGGKGITWGAAYWQYFEQLDKITAAETPLQLKKILYKVEQTAQGDMLTPITAQAPLRIGDKVKVKVELRVNRSMEFVHLKDMRAACFEPVNVLSGYRYQNGLGYYESTKDMATHFFFSYLPTGTYVFEYPMVVTHNGAFSNGVATAQCMYAPEFSSHSEGLHIDVKE